MCVCPRVRGSSVCVRVLCAMIDFEETGRTLPQNWTKAHTQTHTEAPPFTCLSWCWWYVSDTHAHTYVSDTHAHTNTNTQAHSHKCTDTQTYTEAPRFTCLSWCWWYVLSQHTHIHTHTHTGTFTQLSRHADIHRGTPLHLLELVLVVCTKSTHTYTHTYTHRHIHTNVQTPRHTQRHPASPA